MLLRFIVTVNQSVIDIVWQHKRTTDTSLPSLLVMRDSLTFPQLFAVAATLKSIDCYVAMTFILNNNNNALVDA